MKVVISKEALLQKQSLKAAGGSRVYYNGQLEGTDSGISFSVSSTPMMGSSDDPNEIRLVPVTISMIFIHIPCGKTYSGQASDIVSVKTPTKVLTPISNISVKYEFIMLMISNVKDIEDIEIEYLTKEEVREEKINSLLN